MELKNDMVHFISEREDKGGVSFAQLNKRFPGIRGNETMVSSNDPNVILWQGLSKEAVATLNDLFREGLIYLHPMPDSWGILIYIVDGGRVPGCPVVRRRPKTGYKTPHWLPVMLRIEKAQIMSRKEHYVA